jgi:hypothetical protein
MASIENKPAARVVSSSPRKANQPKTDPRHPLEFAFAAVEQRDQFVRAVVDACLPAPDPEVAAALAQLEDR